MISENKVDGLRKSGHNSSVTVRKERKNAMNEDKEMDDLQTENKKLRQQLLSAQQLLDEFVFFSGLDLNRSSVHEDAIAKAQKRAYNLIQRINVTMHGQCADPSASDEYCPNCDALCADIAELKQHAWRSDIENAPKDQDILAIIKRDIRLIRWIKYTDYEGWDFCDNGYGEGEMIEESDIKYWQLVPDC